MHSSRCRGKFANVRAVRFERFNVHFRACQAAKFHRYVGVGLGWVLNLIDGLDVEAASCMEPSRMSAGCSAPKPAAFVGRVEPSDDSLSGLPIPGGEITIT